MLEQDNAHLLAQISEVNAQVSDLAERDHVREDELVQAHRERDVQRAAAEQKAQEVEAQVTELRRNALALEQRDKALEAKEAELQRKKLIFDLPRLIFIFLFSAEEGGGR